MGQALTADLMFRTPEAKAFRSKMLDGCRVLDVEELRLLADELHDCARARRDHPRGFAAYARDANDAPIFDRRL